MISQQEYCPYCGSSTLVESDITRGNQSRGVSWTLGVDNGPIKASMGRDGNQNNRNDTSRLLQCTTCRNIKAQNSSPSFPIHFISLRPKISVLPSSLLSQMSILNCTEEDAHRMLLYSKRDVESYYEDFLRKASNPCSNNKVGHKITVPIGGKYVKCWLIIDLIPDGVDTKLAFRFSHMGSKVTCP